MAAFLSTGRGPTFTEEATTGALAGTAALAFSSLDHALPAARRARRPVARPFHARPGCANRAAPSRDGAPMAKPAPKDDDAATMNIAADRLRSIVERIERLEEERKALASDIKDIYAEAKSAGFDVKVIRQIIRLRKQEPAEVEEQETLLDIYRRALGM